MASAAQRAPPRRLSWSRRGGPAPGRRPRWESSGAAVSANPSMASARRRIVASPSPAASSRSRRELADRLQHREAEVAVGRLHLGHEALLGQRFQTGEGRRVRRPGRRRPPPPPASTPGEDREAAERAPCSSGTRAGRGSSRSSPAGCRGGPAGRAAAGQQRQGAVETRQHRLGREEADAGGRPARSPAAAVQPAADLGHRRRVLVRHRERRADGAGPLDEEAGRRRSGRVGRARAAACVGAAGKGGTGNSRSPRSRSGARLVASTTEPRAGGQQPSRRTGAASGRCSTLSSTSRSAWRGGASASVSGRGRHRHGGRGPRRPRPGRGPGRRPGASGTKKTPSG
jgi:hypothetical protein